MFGHTVSQTSYGSHTSQGSIFYPLRVRDNQALFLLEGFDFRALIFLKRQELQGLLYYKEGEPLFLTVLVL